VAGADLKAVADLSDDQLHKYLELGSRVFGLLCSFPFPTAAAINAAALGGGLEIAMHCDGLIAATPVATAERPAKPYPVGLPEAGLGICPGWGGTNLLPARLDPAAAITMTAEGKPTTSDKAQGLFDAIAPTGQSVIEAAKQWLITQRITRADRDGAPRCWIGRPAIAARVIESLDGIRASLPDTDAARAVADAVDVGLTQGWQAALARERDHLVRLRHTPRAKDAIAAFFAKSGS
jgi:enoyl-CoA hydratase/carnithine racemase